LPELRGALGSEPLAIFLTARRARLAERWAEWQRVGAEPAQWQGADKLRRTSAVHSIELSLRLRRLAVLEPAKRRRSSPS